MKKKFKNIKFLKNYLRHLIFLYMFCDYNHYDSYFTFSNHNYFIDWQNYIEKL